MDNAIFSCSTQTQPPQAQPRASLFRLRQAITLIPADFQTALRPMPDALPGFRARDLCGSWTKMSWIKSQLGGLVVGEGGFLELVKWLGVSGLSSPPWGRDNGQKTGHWAFPRNNWSPKTLGIVGLETELAWAWTEKVWRPLVDQGAVGVQGNLETRKQEKSLTPLLPTHSPPVSYASSTWACV
jgi:hypothetical protein